MKKYAILLILLAIFGMVGVAQAIINGQPDGNGHPYVGIVQGTRNGQTEFCSVVAISQKVVLTSAHCFDQPGVLLTFESDATAASRKVVSGTYNPDPQFCGDCSGPDFNSHDIAVIILDKGVKLSRYGSLPDEGLVDTLASKTGVSIVGYGVQNFNTGGGQPSPSTNFSRYFAPVELIKTNEANSDEFIKVSANPSNDKGSVCFGDSGGPDLLGNTDTILALNSYGSDTLCNSVNYSYRVDTAEALNFIHQFLKK